jgi:hypothetical protein
MKSNEVAGILTGLVVACGFLVLVSVLLLSVEGTSAKVLVAVWLWLLPALALGAAAGWLLAKALSLFLRSEP